MWPKGRNGGCKKLLLLYGNFDFWSFNLGCTNFWSSGGSCWLANGDLIFDCRIFGGTNSLDVHKLLRACKGLGRPILDNLGCQSGPDARQDGQLLHSRGVDVERVGTQGRRRNEEQTAHYESKNTIQNSIH